MIEIPTHPNYSKNSDRCPANYMPCVVCGKGINPESRRTKWVHVHNGGTHLVTEEEAATMNEAADLGNYPIGNDCLKKHPELKKYTKE